MADYKHGAYGEVYAAGEKLANVAESTIVYVGTAPVQQTEGYADRVNKPIAVKNMGEFKKAFGYSDNWGDYTLCEAAYVHFNVFNAGPIVCINVLNPAVHKADDPTTVSKTAENGIIIIDNAQEIVLSSINITGKTKGTDYNAVYDAKTSSIIIAGANLGTAALSITYDVVVPGNVANSDIIGTDDEAGSRTGLYAIRNVYQIGYVPAYLAAPGFSSVKDIHDVMKKVSVKVGGHWDTYMFVDIPITDNGTAITLATAHTWKDTNGYNAENESVYFPMIEGTDGKKYHLSVLSAAIFLGLLNDNDGIPYNTASNKACGIIQNLWLGSSSTGRVYDDEIINNQLNKYGINSAAFVSGRWCVWGRASADHSPTNNTYINVSETNRMMLFYISNDFQNRRMADVDTVMTKNDLDMIIAEEQTRIDALIKIGALLGGECFIDAESLNRSDVYSGDYSFNFNITTTPLCKSLTAIVTWTDDGFETFFAQNAG